MTWDEAIIPWIFLPVVVPVFLVFFVAIPFRYAGKLPEMPHHPMGPA
jgi:hypothetical protein